MTNNDTILQKTFHFNPKYKDSPAFSTAFTIIKACGNHDFYKKVKEDVSFALSSTGESTAGKILSDIDYLSPRKTDVDQELLSSAQYKLSRTIEGVVEDGYSSQTEFEDMAYAQQVFFCLTSALSFFSQTQRVENELLRIQEDRPEILEAIERDKRRQEMQAKKSTKRSRRR